MTANRPIDGLENDEAQLMAKTTPFPRPHGVGGVSRIPHPPRPDLSEECKGQLAPARDGAAPLSCLRITPEFHPQSEPEMAKAIGAVRPAHPHKTGTFAAALVALLDATAPCPGGVVAPDMLESKIRRVRNILQKLLSADAAAQDAQNGGRDCASENEAMLLRLQLAIALVGTTGQGQDPMEAAESTQFESLAAEDLRSGAKAALKDRVVEAAEGGDQGKR